MITQQYLLSHTFVSYMLKVINPLLSIERQVLRRSRINIFNSGQRSVQNFCSSPIVKHKPVWPYLYRTHPSPNMAPQLSGFFKTVDDMSETFIDRLRKAVAIPSISSEDARRPDVVKVSIIIYPQTYCLPS